MKDMRQLERMGVISPNYMSELEVAMMKDDSLSAFGRHLELVSAKEIGEVKNKCFSTLTRNQRKRYRKKGLIA